MGNKQKNILIFGGTGLIGQALVNELSEDYDVLIVTRSKKQNIGKNKYLVWDYESIEDIKEYLDNSSYVINLIGENIASGRWTKAKKKKIVASRLCLPRLLYKYYSKAQKKPEKYIQASAIGYYPLGAEEEMDESSPSGNSFLSQVTKKWEEVSKPLEEIGVEVVVLRTGIVLSNEGGAFPKLTKPFRMGVGIAFGKGEEWCSWIHVYDYVAAVKFMLSSHGRLGVYNIVSPFPIKNCHLFSLLAKNLHPLLFVKLPTLLPKLIFGQMAKETILSSQKVLPKRLSKENFHFKYPRIEETISDLCKSKVD